MTAARVDEASDDDFARAALDHLAPAQRFALARCAAVTVFDPEMYRTVLCPPEGPDLEELVENGTLEQLATSDDRFRVLPALKSAAWASWFGDAVQHTPSRRLRTFAEKLQRYCEETDNAVEQLRVLLLLDADRAADTFVKAFDSCDRNDDLAGCQSLLNVLDAASHGPGLGGGRLADLKREKHRRLSALRLSRRVFLDETLYLQRPKLQDDLERLLDVDADSKAPPLRLHGSGGRGKSTLLRWLINNRVERDLVACAFVDLDYLDPVNMTRHPWLIALEIAKQLNDQIYGRPFEKLLTEYRTYLSLLIRRPDDHQSPTPDLDTGVAGIDGKALVSRFLQALPDALSAGPVLVVLDTFEEATLRPRSEAASLLDLLGRLRDAQPAVRLVISGRGTQSEDTLLSTEFGAGGPTSVLVPGFDDEESKKYLTDVRNVEREDLLDLLVGRADGLPWQLALDADIVEQYPTITPDQLRGLDSGVAWAVDRIIGRIDDEALRWLIRYGCVPRRLSRDILEQVLLPRLSDAMMGSDIDDPRADPLPDPDAPPVFRTGLTAPSADQLWASLLRYAAESSWLQAAGLDAVELEPNLRVPMCRLVSAQPVGELLHRDLLQYHEERAATDDEWLESTIEAIYHRSRLTGDVDGDDWRAAVAHAERTNRPEWTAGLSEEIVGPDYLHDDGESSAFRYCSATISQDLLAAGQAERAWATARLARRQQSAGSDQLWSVVERSVRAAIQLPADSTSRWSYDAAEGALKLARGEPDSAILSLLPLTADAPDGSARPDRYEVLLLLADAYRAVHRRAEAQSTLLTAHRSAEEARSTDSVMGNIEVALALDSASRGLLDEAATWASTPGRPDTPARSRLRARIALDSGLPTRALNLAILDELVPERAEALTALGRPRSAVQVCSDALVTALEPPEYARVLMHRGLALAALLDVDNALKDLARAQLKHSELNDVESEAVCGLHTVRLCLREVGNLRDAEQHLEAAQRLPLSPGSTAWIRYRLLRAELEGRLERRMDASAVSQY